MIFFVIDAGHRDQTALVTDLRAFTDSHQGPANNRLVSWNEVYPLRDPPQPADESLWVAVKAAAAVDPICVEMLRKLLSRHGLDPFAAAPQWFATAARETLAYWANPRIGNISATWGLAPRRAVGPTAIDKTWLTRDFLDEETHNAIRALDDRVGAPARSARDQVRICHHITDLARAFVGEMTTYVAKRAEKTFALELCSSSGLETELAALLAEVKERAAIPGSFKFSTTEYLSYYLAEIAGTLQGSAAGVQAKIAEALWADAIGRTATDVPPEMALVTPIWNKLPKVIQQSILMNDFRKVLLGTTGGSVTVRSTHLRNPTTYGFGVRAETIDLTISQTQRAGSGWRFVEHWAPDERHIATKSARQMLSPIWAGPSGHVAKNLVFYRWFLGSKYPESANRAIPAGLFALWRLYYDRRYSPTHTLVETCEGTTHDLEMGGVTRRIGAVGQHGRVDPFDLFAEAQVSIPPRRAPGLVALATRRMAHPGGTFLDGAAVLEMLHRRYLGGNIGNLSNSTDKPLQVTMDQLRITLTAGGRVVPQWSHELDEATTGVSASPFRPPARPLGRRVRQLQRGQQ